MGRRIAAGHCICMKQRRFAPACFDEKFDAPNAAVTAVQE